MPSYPTQVALTSSQGCIASIGISFGRDKGALVGPFAIDGALDKLHAAEDLCGALIASALTSLTACMSSDAEITFVEAHGMTPSAVIPFREDFAPGTWPGTRAAGLSDGQQAAVVLLYCDNNAPGPKHKMQIGKMFVPGLADTDIVQDLLNGALTTALESFAFTMCSAMPGSISHDNWYRVGAARHTLAQPLPKVIKVEAPGVIATQRRRLQR